MNNVSLKKALVLSLSIISLSSSAGTLTNTYALAIQCQTLSESVAILIAGQAKHACVEKLTSASHLIENSGRLILDGVYVSAKKELDKAIYSLQYAELNSCNKYIQISHSKMEAHKIKHSI